MRSALHGLVLGVTTLLAASAGAQQPRGGYCAPPEGMPLDSLRAAVGRLHPEALTPENRARSVVVGLLFDAQCRLTHHALTHRAADGLSVDTTLARLFPAAYTPRRFVVSGIAEAAGEGPSQPKSPWIVWAIVPAPGNTR